MAKRQFKSDREALLAQGAAFVTKGRERRFHHRIEMVNLVLAGMSPATLSQYVTESASTISEWVKTVDEIGFDALLEKKQSGRPPKLSVEQLQEVKRLVNSVDPRTLGFDAWNGPNLASLIAQRFGVTIGLRQCQRTLLALRRGVK